MTEQDPPKKTKWRDIALVILGLLSSFLGGWTVKPTPEPVVIETVVTEPAPAAPKVTVTEPEAPEPPPPPNYFYYVKVDGITLELEKAKDIIAAAKLGKGDYQVQAVAAGHPDKLLRVVIGDSTMPIPSTPAPVPNVPVPPVDPPAPTVKIKSVTYVYEKDQGAVPADIHAALDGLNREKGVVATAVDDDSTVGGGQVPEQYKVAITTAREKGLPCIVTIDDDGKMVSFIKSPKADQVWGIVP